MPKIKNHKRVCTICNQAFGQDRSLIRHLNNEHGFVDTPQNLYNLLVLENVVPVCKCNTCNLTPTWVGWIKGYNKFVDGHSGFLSSFSDEKADEIREKRISTKKKNAKPGWNKGLTKETSAILKCAAERRSETVKGQFDRNERNAWNKGLTKETSDSIKKQSVNMKSKFKSGVLIPWAKGLTKETDSRVFRMSQTNHITHTQISLRNHLDSIKRLSEGEILERLSQIKNLTLITNIKQYTRDKHNNLSFRCNDCGDIRERSLISALTGKCFVCNPKESKQQLEINRFLIDNEINTVLSNREIIKPYELDIWIPRKKFAIEYNGLYWHSERMNRNKNYHSMKTKLCEELGIQLIHIFGDEWSSKQEIIKSVLMHKIGKTKNTVFARKCKIVYVNAKERKVFFDKNHIDGDVPSKIAFGLTYDNVLVSCISLKIPRQKKYADTIEIARFATTINTSVVGGLSKLVKKVSKWACDNKFSSIMTYVDTRFGTGVGYEKCGFSQIGKTANRFWWTDDVYRYNRFKYRAKNGISEKNIAAAAGVKKIWGCANLIYKIAI